MCVCVCVCVKERERVPNQMRPGQSQVISQVGLQSFALVVGFTFHKMDPLPCLSLTPCKEFLVALVYNGSKRKGR